MKGFKKILNYILCKRFSKKEKQYFLVIAFIVIVASNFFIARWLKNIKNQQLVITAVIPKAVVDMQLPDKKITPIKTKQYTPQAVEKKKPLVRDPFLDSKKSQLSTSAILKKPVLDLKVSGILLDQNIPTAIINSKVVKIGDVISGKTIVDIEKETVILMEDGDLYILELRKK